jgi:hypothetical protein
VLVLASAGVDPSARRCDRGACARLSSERDQASPLEGLAVVGSTATHGGEFKKIREAARGVPTPARSRSSGGRRHGSERLCAGGSANGVPIDRNAGDALGLPPLPRASTIRQTALYCRGDLRHRVRLDLPALSKLVRHVFEEPVTLLGSRNTRPRRLDSLLTNLSPGVQRRTVRLLETFCEEIEPCLRYSVSTTRNSRHFGQPQRRSCLTALIAPLPSNPPRKPNHQQQQENRGEPR